MLYSPLTILTDQLLETISHELVHREQIIRSSGKAKHFKLSDEPTQAEKKKYIANKHEIMAFANQTVLSLRHEGFTDEEIIDMCKNPMKWENRLYNTRDHLDIYLLQYFEETHPVAKKFKKYVVAYLEKK